MKKNLIYLTMAFLMAIPSIAYSGKLDLQLKMLTQRPDTGKAMLGKSVSVKGGREVVDVIIKSSDKELTRESIEENGGTVRSVIGKIMTAFVPISYLDALENLDEVEAVEASVPMKNLLDSARSNTGVATLQAGYQDVRYTGKNVVVGVIDTGIDYSRSDFDNSDGESRVQYLRFQSVAEDGFSITECANDAIRDGSCEISDDNDKTAGHGTHVTGIAAGSDSVYTGIAKAADIMLVRNDYYDDIDEDESSSFTAGVLDGVAEIFKKADILDKPAVINISQGTHIGAHDDTSLLEQGINDAVAGEYADNGKNYGRAVVAAAGNEYINYDILGAIDSDYADHAGGIHSSFQVLDGESQAWRLWVILGGAVGRIPLIVDAWFGVGSEDHCSVASNVYSYDDVAGGGASTSKAVASIEDMLLSENTNESDESSDKMVSTVVATDGADARNGKPRAMVAFGPGSKATTIAEAQAIMNDDIGITSGEGYVLDVIIRASGGECRGNMWLEGGGTYANFMRGIDTGAFDMTSGDNGAAYKFKAGQGKGNNAMTVGLPATASGVIAVGAYLQEKPYGNGTSVWLDYELKEWDATDINSDPDDEAQINGGTIMERCPFSSIGPTATGAVKPEIMAPGDPVISTLARGYDTFYETEYDMSFIPLKIDGAHFKSQGTSQASPHIAGLVALLFQKNDTLTADQTKDAIIAGGSLTTPTYNVGYGNVSATKVIDSVSSPDTRGYSGTGDLKTSDINPSSSKGCGGSIAPFDSAGSVSQIIMLALAAAGMAVRRMKRF